MPSPQYNYPARLAKLPSDDWLEHYDYWQFYSPQRLNFVYVIRAESGPIKVGIARDPEARLRAHQTSNFDALEILHVLPGGSRLEAELHRRLKDSRIRGEWFGGPAVEGFLKWVAGYADYLVQQHHRNGEIPETLHIPKRSKGKGMIAAGFTGKPLNSRWRLSDNEAHPVKIRFVDPATLKRAA